MDKFEELAKTAAAVCTDKTYADHAVEVILDAINKAVTQTREQMLKDQNDVIAMHARENDRLKEENELLKKEIDHGKE